MLRNLNMVLVTAVCAAACCQSALAQVLAPTILEIDIENLVEYQNDIADPSRFGTNPNITPSAGLPAFGPLGTSSPSMASLRKAPLSVDRGGFL